MLLKYTTEKLNFFYLHSYMKIFQAKRKNSNPKPFPGGRVARLCRDGMRDTYCRFAFLSLRHFALRQNATSLVRWRSKLHSFGDDLIRLGIIPLRQPMADTSPVWERLGICHFSASSGGSFICANKRLCTIQSPFFGRGVSV